jgi:hypothetical protein
MKLLSAFSGGLWIIPLLLLFGAAWFLIIAIRKHNSGSHYQDRRTGRYVDAEGNVPLSKIGQFWFAIALAAAAVGAAIWMYLEK